MKTLLPVLLTLAAICCGNRYAIGQVVVYQQVPVIYQQAPDLPAPVEKVVTRLVEGTTVTHPTSDVWVDLPRLGPVRRALIRTVLRRKLGPSRANYYVTPNIGPVVTPNVLVTFGRIP